MRKVSYGNRGFIYCNEKTVNFNGTVSYHNRPEGDPKGVSSRGGIYYTENGLAIRTIYPSGQVLSHGIKIHYLAGEIEWEDL
jgi:hypothetical protein